MKSTFLKGAALVALVLAASCGEKKEPETQEEKPQRLEFVMDMVHDNPGEAKTVSKYTDPKFLKSKGYDAAVPHWHVQCAVTFDNFEENIIPQGSESRKWIEEKAAWIDEKLDKMEAEGIDVYPFTDFVVLPAEIFEKYGTAISGEGEVEMGNMKAEQAKKSDMRSELLQKLVVAQVNAIFDRFPKLDGLTLRFGETYLQDAPHHRGGSPIRKDENGPKDHIILMNLLREEICVKRNKKLFYRTWDFGNRFHVNPEYYLAVTDSVEPHENLIMSIKHQSDDFHRMVHFNETLGIGNHRQIVEVCCQLDSYGKAAHPYYNGKGVIDGWPETEFELSREGGWHFTGKPADPGLKRGIKELLATGKLAGVFTWSRGGGWFGPHIKHEINTDINTLVMSRWAQDTSKSEEEVFFEVADDLGIKGENAQLYRDINLKTIEAVRKGHCNSFAVNAVWWTRDHFFDIAQNKWTIKEVIDNDLIDKFLAEKEESAAGWRDIEKMAKPFEAEDKKMQEAFIVSTTYGRIKYELIQQMWIMMLYDAKGKKENKAFAPEIKNALARYDALWEEWRALEKNNPSCASIYTDLAMWHEKEGSIGELVAKLRIATK